MAGVNIQAKVKAGLSKARVKTGASGAGLVELRVLTGGNSDPIYPVNPTDSYVELVDCIFKSVDESIMANSLVEAGSIAFVANGDVEIKQNDVLRRNGELYVVGTVDVKNPTGVILAYSGTAKAQ